MDNFVLVIAVISIIFILAAIFLGRLKKRWPKYIPAIFAAVAAIASFVKAKWFSEGFEALGYFVFMLIALIIFITALIAASAIEIISLRKRRTGGGFDRTGPDNGGTDRTGPDNGGSDGASE